MSSRNLILMSKTDFNNTELGAIVFADPVGYLAELGIAAEVVAETTMPAAA